MRTRRRAGVHFQLRQNHARYADGRDAPEHSGGVRLRRPMEAGKVTWQARPKAWIW